VENLHNLFETGEGIYPDSFFFKHCEYEIRKFGQFKNSSNDNMRLYLANLITNKMKYKLYIREEGFLDFPAVSFIVPGASEVILDVCNMELVDNMFIKHNFIKYYQNLYNLDTETMSIFIRFIEKFNIQASVSIDDIANFMIPQKYNHFKDITLDLFLTMLYIRTGDMISAKKSMERFIDYLKKMDTEINTIRYNEMICLFLKYKIEGFNEEQIFLQCKQFFEENEIYEGLKDISVETIFDGLPTCNCPDCDAYISYSVCAFDKNKRILFDLLSYKSEFYVN
jgi:hypothetical protein